MNFIKSLFSGDETVADSAIVAGFVILLVMVVLVMYSVIWRGEHFDVMQFAGSSGGTVSGIAAARRLRDGRANQAPSP